MENLLTDIERFIAEHNMRHTAFGRLAVNDGHFVGDLRGRNGKRPRRIWPEQEVKVRAFMESYVALENAA